MWARVACALLCVVCACDAVAKKFCGDVNPEACTIQSVEVDPCSKGVNFCSVYRNKPYTLAVDFTPRFSAQNLRLDIYADDNNDGTFDRVVKTVGDPCDLMTCPVDRDIPRFFNMPFSLDKTITSKDASAKFPVKFKLWNANNNTQACCFTFSVKVIK